MVKGRPVTQVDFLGTEHDLLLSYLIGQIISRHFKMAAETTEITIPRLEATIPSRMLYSEVPSLLPQNVLRHTHVIITDYC